MKDFQLFKPFWRFIHPSIHQFNLQPTIHSFIHSSIHPFIHSFIRSFVRSFVHSEHPSIIFEVQHLIWNCIKISSRPIHPFNRPIHQSKRLKSNNQPSTCRSWAPASHTTLHTWGVPSDCPRPFEDVESGWWASTCSRRCRRLSSVRRWHVCSTRRSIWEPLPPEWGLTFVVVVVVVYILIIYYSIILLLPPYCDSSIGEVFNKYHNRMRL